mmetsp:Transcript_24758/g.28252  ORF Transcript_24758/g.28252 Transcript_24758/m.28252 type:complete len:342 (-) Transcript_24758:756-1781(-)|eukprot:CAMPEP_0115014376 /NCGR_PEP_ID=MMETSP0216-20121206/26037_1 /TAXON_ID=223996 /ORGANISM="Protocruzia adherens, Strain Boccale" /LENGTH=341 /DNA_ID=CAMNT_0002384095 /DNA_START=181 /DNA_END=1206 /DNA_ORIENTATION=-
MMRKFWYGTSPESYSRAEQDLLDRSGVEDYEVQDISIGNDEHIHLIKMGKGEPMLLFHGYGAACLIFWKILRRLSEHFTVYTCDMPGMGASSRSGWKAKNREEAEEFFVERFEKIREALGLTDYILAGHSMGGYLSTVFALKYPKGIKQLLLLSPVGIPERPEGTDIKSRVNSLPWKRRTMFKVGIALWNRNLSPFSVVRFLGRLGRGPVRSYTKRRMGELATEEQKELENYMYEYGSMPGCSEYALGLILEPGAFARAPLITRIEDFEMPVALFYGDDDWMDPRGGELVLDKIKQKGQLFLISNAGHHLYFDNPEEFTDAILMATGKSEFEMTYEPVRNY